MKSSERILSLPALERILSPVARGTRTVALANGTFDVFHVGHVRYLQAAAELADVLVVAVNSDRSVRAIKGPPRPLVVEGERAEIVAAVEGVDYVVLFDELTVENVIRQLKPDVQVKGTDYTPQTVPEGDLVRSYGGRVAIAGDPKDHSSSSLIRDLQRS